ncbi:Bacterial extracellular solute-binding protein [Paenibacillus konkukensis]|uniref:Bacterial extracellular solute-binding protein n=1 Tax=Paenibacillus konkukensis TaxID=2020716 RepID=A0ABY4RIY9_9BACL|nr:Bacterial extracellular solute-binding protein [Paenibacillus konkukensis]
MKTLVRTRPWLATVLALVFVLGPTLPGLADGSGESPGSGATDAKTTGIVKKADESQSLDPYYLEVLEKWKKNGAAMDHKGMITVPGNAVSGKSEQANVSAGSYDGKNNVLIWNAQGDEWIEYEVNVEQGGLYTMELSYHPFVDPKHRKPIAWNVSVDGANPYLESKSVQLYRHWKDQLPARTDDNGDEIRPMAEDVSGWLSDSFRDSGGSYEDPLLWYLTPGKHKIRFAGSDPVAIESVSFKAPVITDPYQTVRRTSPADAAAVQADPIVIEAEQVDWKNDSSIPLSYDNDIASVPYVRGKITYNTIDGERWSTGNQEASWSFEVPESGYYKIAMRAQQSFLSNRSSFRTISINGKVPFAELKAYRFLYASGWKGVTLEDSAGKPFEFYLQKGKNTLSMRVTQAPLKPVIIDLESGIADLKKLAADLKALTGGVDDKNRTWEIRKDLPGFIEQLGALGKKLADVRTRLETVNGRPDAVSQGIVTVEQDIQSLLKNENEIPYEASRLVTLQGKIGDLIQQLNTQPLQLDRIFIAPVEKSFPKMEASMPQKIQGAFINFFYSFMPKENLNKMQDDVLNVWVLRGRDYVNLLQDLANESFTPQTGIKVKVNLLPDAGLLVLMNAAGIAPDVALGLGQDLPFEYAMRNGIYDLKQFPDFDEVYKQFAPGSWTPFYYNGGYYGMPETQTFQMMYYRKDVLQSLGLSVPDTWDDVYKMLPILQQNGMNITPVGHNPFFLQNGADYFAADGSKTALGTEKGFDSFKKWTDLYNKYAVDRSLSSFYQHFRDGTIPLGIGDLGMYIELTVAAPELNGWWGVAPIPGVKQPDGTVARWMGGGMQSSAIFKQTKKPQESWEFLKWWTSAEIQERYGTDLETLNGVSFRWNTSNIDAFAKLPWKKDDLNAIMEQWRWFREIPNVPGSYFMERELQNAWNRTVVDGINYRTSLETAIVDIDREIQRKMQEFHFIDDNGNVVKSLNLPSITKPWEGVDKYVKK